MQFINKVKKVDFPVSALTTDGMKTLELPIHYEYCDIWLNVPFSVKDGMELHLHIITPPGVFPDDFTAEKPVQKYPLVVYCVGSAWMPQNMGHMLSRLEPFCKRGYVIALAEYRPSPVAPFPAQIKDLKTAVRFMEAHAEEYAVDTERIYVWGDSSGGHCSVMVNATWDDEEYNDESTPLNIRAFVDFYGPSDLTRMNHQPTIIEHMAADSAEGLFIGGNPVGESPDWTDRANPMNHIQSNKKMRPQLIFHGNQDRLVPFEQSILLYEKLKAANKDVTFYQVKGADHAEDVFFHEQILDIIDTFFREN